MYLPLFTATPKLAKMCARYFYLVSALRECDVWMLGNDIIRELDVLEPKLKAKLNRAKS